MGTPVGAAAADQAVSRSIMSATIDS
jgi:hypothetical protein